MLYNIADHREECACLAGDGWKDGPHVCCRVLLLSDEHERLSDSEGTLLGLVARAGPITTYQIIKAYEESPVSTFSASKGKLYPIVRRLKERGLIRACRITDDARGTEALEATDQGKRALKAWVMDIRSAHLLLDDPLRTRVQSFDLLNERERIEWLMDAKAALRTKLEEVEEYGLNVTVPFQEFVHENAVRALRSRMDWLDIMLQSMFTRTTPVNR